MQYNDLLELLQNADPAELDAMFQGGLAPQRMGVDQQQMGIAGDLAGTPSATGQQTGQIYRASSPLEHAAVALRRYMGMKQQQQAIADQRKLIDQMGLGRRANANIIAGGGGGVSEIPSSGTGGEF